VITINDKRLAFLKCPKTWPVFGKGWGARVGDIADYCFKLPPGTVLGS